MGAPLDGVLLVRFSVKAEINSHIPELVILFSASVCAAKYNQGVRSSELINIRRTGSIAEHFANALNHIFAVTKTIQPFDPRQPSG